jgi:signal transduction histidine kinase
VISGIKKKEDKRLKREVEIMGQKNYKGKAFKIASKYFVFGFLWILFSDRLLSYFVSDASVYQSVQLYKGWFYILITTLLLYIFAKKELREVQKWFIESKKKAGELEVFNEQLETRIEERTNELKSINEILLKNISEKENLYKDLQIAHNNLENYIKSYEKMQEEIIKTERMAALGGMVAGLAHELSTPIGIGVTASSYMKESINELNAKNDITDKNKISDLIKSISDAYELLDSNLNKLVELVESVKQISVDGTVYVKRNIDLKNYLRQIIQTLRPLFKEGGHNIELDIKCCESWDTYPGALTQIITNLVSNSIIHGFENRDGGNISLRAEEGENFIDIEFKDDGIGIDNENLNYIFEPFYTTKQNRGGTGLGLNIVYNLVVQKFKGSIKCVSKIDEGTTFYIRLKKEI